MPELPEVETIKTAIEKHIQNARIENVIVNNNRFRIKTPDDLADKLIGSKISSYQRRAKYMLIHLDNGYSIIWHLGMSGRIKIMDKTPDILEKHDHIVIETSKGVLIYNDARRFGFITYSKTIEIGDISFFKTMGIEPFDEKLNEEYLLDKLKNKTTPIKISLLDQSIIVGIGNIYASEILFLANISPLKESKDITKKEAKNIIESTKIILKQAIEAGGSTLKDYKKPDGSLGYFQNLHCVYGKSGQKCKDCTCDITKTGGIKKITQAGRSTFFCSKKQK